MEKVRLDQKLMDLNMVESRARAKGEIMTGNVIVNDVVITKAGYQVSADDKICFKKAKFAYVSRGALKLLEAFKLFDLDVLNERCIDIGSSTGGFTEVLLEKGAKEVVALDVGTNQLAYKLRVDNRVISMEKTNARYMSLEMFDNIAFDTVVTDVAFISLTKILDKAYEVLKHEGKMIALIKPQFEAGKDKVTPKGVVYDKDIHREVIEKIIEFAQDIGFDIIDIGSSPIKGPKGNKEFLLYLNKRKNDDVYSKNYVSNEKIKEVVYEE